MAQGKILVVEDNPLNREMIITVLEAYGYTVLEAEDGLGLMERVKAERPGLIIMDLQLPKIDGFALTRNLKADASTRDIPVVAASAFAKSEDQALALDAGCAFFLTKPLDLTVLLQTVARFLPQGAT
ncbi:MAG: response regulator [Candidatus Methylomirabilis oxygeniifera]|uniref:Response regulator receiver protein n=1 Tax=Methylomirabilis oxygeniifera TaxID=671143 RepID=D5MEZ8_METO1|nr:MAG: response regulator [Candidatus Methylomirabilis oxyfera]CBE68327.1 Response regulator receiver protein [Candidatus Methylomirabilis oxyfera]